MSTMSALEKAFAVLMVRNPTLTYEQVMALARQAVESSK